MFLNNLFINAMQYDTSSNENYACFLFQKFVKYADGGYSFREFRNAQIISIENEMIVRCRNNQDFEMYLGDEAPAAPGNFRECFLLLYKFRNAIIYLPRPLILKGEYSVKKGEFFHNSHEYQVKFNVSKDLLQMRNNITDVLLETSTANGKVIKIITHHPKLKATPSLNTPSPNLPETNVLLKESLTPLKQNNVLRRIKNIFSRNPAPSQSVAPISSSPSVKNETLSRTSRLFHRNPKSSLTLPLIKTPQSNYGTFSPSESKKTNGAIDKDLPNSASINQASNSIVNRNPRINR